MRSKQSFAILTAAILATGSANATVLVSDTFDRADNTALGTLDNGLGGTISASWQEVGGDHAIAGNQAAINTNYDDSYINYGFSAAELGPSFSVEFDLVDQGGSGWTAFELAQDTGFWTDSDAFSEATRLTTVLGLLIRNDDQLVVWDGGNNGTGKAPLDYSTNPGRFKIVIDSPNGYGAGETATMTLFFDDGQGGGYAQFTNLRNEGLSSYDFVWNDGGDVYLGFEGSGPGSLIDNFVVTSVPEPGSLALLGLGGLALIRRRRA